MSQTDARKLKPGDDVRLKNDVTAAKVVAIETSGRVVYVERHGTKISVACTEIRLPKRGQ